MLTDRLLRHYYGHPMYDGTNRFYDWVRRYTRRDTKLLNLGAGPATRSAVRSFKGEVAWVTGADIDPIIFDNPEIDEAVLIKDGRLPLPDASFDIVVSDYVLEHVERPAAFMGEVYRVLEPGGSFFFRTPNCMHYIALASAVTPHWFHEAISNRVRRIPADSHAPYPTFYRMNGRGRLRRLAQDAGFRAIELDMVETEPSYLMFNPVAFLMGTAYERMVNSAKLLEGLRANIFARIEK